MSFNDAVNTAKQGIDDLLLGGDEDESADVEGIEPETDDEVTAEDRAESNFAMPEEVDTIVKTITKQSARMAEKAINKAIDDLFK